MRFGSTIMTEFLQLALALVILIAAAKLGGYISLRLGQPSVLGELIAGLILGPSVLDTLHHTPFTSEHLDETIALLAEMGVLLLMFLAGLELHIKDLVKSGKVSTLAGTLGVVFPVAMGFGIGRPIAGALHRPGAGRHQRQHLGPDADGVEGVAQPRWHRAAGRGRVRRRAGDPGAVGSAGRHHGRGWAGQRRPGSVAHGLVPGRGYRSRGAGAAAAGAPLVALPRLARRVDKLPISQGLVAFVLVTLLLYAWAAEALGSMAAITGAFLAGLFLSRSPLRERIQSSVSVIAYGLFVPIFFISVGLVADAHMLAGQGLWLIIAMIVVAIVSKVAGAGLGARLAGFSNRESLQLGTGMMSRGEVGLIVATLGVSEGLLSGQVFSGVVGVVIVTTLLTPPALRFLFTRPATPAQSPSAGAVEE